MKTIDIKTKKEKTKKPNPLIGELISDYRELNAEDLWNSLRYKTDDPKHFLYLFHREIERRLEDCKKKGKKPEVCLRTFQVLMAYLEVKILHNQMTHRIEIKSDDFKSVESLGLAEEQRYLLVRELCRSYNFPVNVVDEYIKLSAVPYHPARDWIHSVEWDFKNRFDDLFETLDCKNENQELAKQFLWKWSLQAVRAIKDDKGHASELVLILIGEQGAGKTRWIRSLVPEEFLKTGLFLNPQNKDSVLEANTAWINELGEIDGMTRKVDHANFKAFLSKTDDYIRRPYALVEERIPRKSVFFGSVNGNSFLVDDTGNRRFLVLECGDINYNHNIDVHQYWREVAIEAQFTTQTHWLDKEEMKQQEEESNKYRMLDPIVQNFQEKEHLLIGSEFFVKEIIEITSEIDKGRITQHQCKIIKQHCLKHGWTEKSCGSGKYLLVKPLGRLSSFENEPKPF